MAVLSTFSCGWKRPLKPEADVTEAPQVAGGLTGVILGDQKGERYIEVLPNHIKSVGVESVFFYDITGDDVPEVWMLTDDCEAQRMVLVHSLSDWGMELYRGPAGHSQFYAGNGYVLRMEAHMGQASWYRLNWDGKTVVSNKVFEEKTGGDYTEPSEKPIDELFPGNLKPDVFVEPNN